MTMPLPPVIEKFKKEKSINDLTAYYDLAYSPPTYDIVAFLCAVEAYRKRQSVYESLQIVILPGPVGGFRKDRFWPFSVAEREEMRDNVAVPMARMMPMASVEVATERPRTAAPKSIGFCQPLYGLAVHVEAMREGVRPLRASLTPHRKDKLVTITLREAVHWPERNSNIDAWMRAAIAIRERGFEVVVIRDNVRADARFGDFQTAPRASSHLDDRANLYMRAACNLFVNNGPAWFAMALDAHVMMFKPTIENLNRSCSAAYFRECGIPPGEQMPGAPSYQRIVWSADTADNIVRAFDEFVEASACVAA